MIIVTVARKPVSEANVAANVLVHGTGGINIDRSRIYAGQEHFRPPIAGDTKAIFWQRGASHP